MKITQTKLDGCLILEPTIYKDERGYFFESFNQKTFEKIIGHTISFVQDNQSFSSKGTLRGLHFQEKKYAQAKLVRVIKGKVLDVVVDLRPKSATFGEHIRVVLSEANQKQLFIPRSFAHGFVVYSNTAIFSYKCDNFYNKKSENGIRYDDKDLNIDWDIDVQSVLISNKDLNLPSLKNISL